MEDVARDYIVVILSCKYQRDKIIFINLFDKLFLEYKALICMASYKPIHSFIYFTKSQHTMGATKQK